MNAQHCPVLVTQAGIFSEGSAGSPRRAIAGGTRQAPKSGGSFQGTVLCKFNYCISDRGTLLAVHVPDCSYMVQLGDQATRHHSPVQGFRLSTAPHVSPTLTFEALSWAKLCLCTSSRAFRLAGSGQRAARSGNREAKPKETTSEWKAEAAAAPCMYSADFCLKRMKSSGLSRRRTLSVTSCSHSHAD